jgi:predicted AlkP superfamily phosphohydrolase/phosphomutase
VSLARRAGEALPLDWLRFVAKNIPGPLRNRAMTLWQAGGIRWESTLAFTCRADLQGYIRLNLEGRERRGTVAPGPERDVLCGRIAEGLASFRDADTGEPIVKEVRQVDDVFPTGERRDRLPDLLVRWQDAPGASHRLVRSDRFGSVARATPGRIPSGRSGNHRGEGMMLACGEAIPAGITTSSQPHIMDLAPTILQLLGSRCGLPLSGRYIPEFAGVEMARPV